MGAVIQAIETISLYLSLCMLGLATGSLVLRMIQLEVRRRGFFNQVKPSLRLQEVEWRKV